MKTKRLYLLAAALLCATWNLQAQTSLAGRVYFNQNILENDIKRETKMREAEAKLADLKKNGLAEAEKKKGRKLTDKEKAELDKRIKEAEAKLDATKKLITTSVTMTFTTATDVETRAKTKIDEQAMKTLEIGWLKRKAMKAAISLMPEQEKTKYVVKGDLVIVGEENDLDTLRLSPDGQTLTVKEEGKTYVLRRTK